MMARTTRRHFGLGALAFLLWCAQPAATGASIVEPETLRFDTAPAQSVSAPALQDDAAAQALALPDAPSAPSDAGGAAHVHAPEAAEAAVASAAAATLPAPDAGPASAAAPAPATRAPLAAAAGSTLRLDASKLPVPGDTAMALRIVLGLTLIAILPAILVSLTAFLRIIIVLSMLRHAMGMQETPPNTVLIGLALFLTMFTMSPVIQQINQDAFQPFMQGTLPMEAAYTKGVQPLRAFIVRQTREQDLALMVELAKAPKPRSMDEVSNVQLVPAFMLSELRTAFQIGFVIFLPFLLIDLIVSSILMGLGMMMMPPASISLPLKILMFVLIDGWSLVLKALVGSFR